MSHVIAVATYGSNKVTNPKSKQRISAQKIGYMGGTAQVLLTLFGDKARDVSSQRASYKYIAFDAKLNVHRGYILLRLDDAQRQQAADITRQHEHSRVFLWRDDRWLLFPTQRHDDYNTPLSGYPSFSPVGMQATSPTSGDKAAAVQGIQIEKSQRDSDRSPWWWVSGDTYAHRDLLKQHGGRWSKKRKSWYFVSDTLPQAVQQLADDVNAHLADAGQTEDTQPDTAPPGSAHQNLSPGQPPDSAHAETSSPQQSPSSAQLVDWVDGTRSFNQRYRTFTSTCHDNVHAIFARELVYEGEWINRREYVEIAFQQKLPMRRSEPDKRGQVVHWIGQRSVSVEEFDYLSFLQHQTKPCSLSEAASVLDLAAKSMRRVQDVAKLRQHVTALVKVPVFEAWAGYLWQAGQSAQLLRRTRSDGGIDIWSVTLDVDAWTRLITGGLADGVIALSQHTL